MFTINAFIHGQQFPLVYGLLPGKSRDVYHEFFMGVKEEAMNNGQHISPEEIMTDFELTLVQSLELEFPGFNGRRKSNLFNMNYLLEREPLTLISLLLDTV